MFCPKCKSEFRAGFERCESCDVDLVADLNAEEEAPRAAEVPVKSTGPALDFCGFLELDEARGAREQLREAGIASEILIRDAPGPQGDEIGEEYWLRCAASDVKHVRNVLGFHDEDDSAGELEGYCSKCGSQIPDDEPLCVFCGTPRKAPA
ncbi:hypothetical protein ABI59_20955 [Acidobacteria bacterium Mor1]|nr:hypothetical protein ABI59_20955 [Acidobacteria bacterium Mor1]